jgi:hypothetical protein
MGEKVTRQIFLRIATTALRQSQGKSPEEQAEAIAQLMDAVAQVLGDKSVTPSGQQSPDSTASNEPSPAIIPPANSFPAPNPNSLANAVTAGVDTDVNPYPSLIVTDTRMPSEQERAAAKSQMEIPRPKEKIRVEDLSLLLQERTPAYLEIEVPFQDGTVKRFRYERNVLSMHAFDSVKLIYSPPGALPSERELMEVETTIHISDLPLNLQEILSKLKQQASFLLKPKPTPRTVEASPITSPIQPGQNYSDGSVSFASESELGGVIAGFQSLRAFNN